MDKNNRLLWVSICVILGAGIGSLVDHVSVGLCLGFLVGNILISHK